MEPRVSNKLIILCLLVTFFRFCSITIAHTADSFLNNSFPVSLIAMYSCLGERSACFVLLACPQEYGCTVLASPRTVHLQRKSSQVDWSQVPFPLHLSNPIPPNRPYHPLKHKCRIYILLFCLPATLGWRAVTFPPSPLPSPRDFISLSPCREIALSVWEVSGRPGTSPESKSKGSQTTLPT